MYFKIYEYYLQICISIHIYELFHRLINKLKFNGCFSILDFVYSVECSEHAEECSETPAPIGVDHSPKLKKNCTINCVNTFSIIQLIV